MKIVSWNVNGLRAIMRKDCWPELEKLQAEIICLQETKTHQEIKFDDSENFESFWSFGQKPGYSGTAIFIKKNAKIQVKRSQDLPKVLTEEGRTIQIELPDFFLINCYFPNGGMGPARLEYKLKFYEIFLQHVLELQKTKPVIFCGDVNTAHTEIDLARPKANSKNTGFLPEERAWLDQVVKHNFVDCWREIHPQTVAYTWWDMKTRARERNVGWRIDYFFCSKSLFNLVKSCEILTHFFGSDHAPVVLSWSNN